MKKYFTLLLIVLLLPIAKAETSESITNEDIEVRDLYCTDDGKFGFKVSPIRNLGEAELKGVLVKQSGDSNFFAVQGMWDRDNIIWNEANLFRTATFTSSEAVIRNEGTAELKFYYDIGGEDKEVGILFDCPGTDFSCKLYDIGVVNCGSSNGVFTAEFRTKGLNNDLYKQVPVYTISDLEFLFVTDNRFCDKQGNCGKSAGIPETAVVDVNDDTIKITWDYESNVKGASINLIPANSCERKTVNYEFSVSDFLSCDPDPYAKEFQCTGCELGSVCVLEGESIIVGGKDLYCVRGELAEQKKVGESCEDNIECLTRNCIAGVCSNELLDKCEEGSLSEECRCGSTDVRTWQGKYCCSGEVFEASCPVEENNNQVEESCSEGFEMINGECSPIEESSGFWSKIGNFFKNLFKRR